MQQIYLLISQWKKGATLILILLMETDTAFYTQTF